jgi:hypothetical protein
MAGITSAATLDNNLTTGGTNSQGLADWAAPYVQNYLGRAQALGDTDYQTYAGPLTAGASDLQNKAFQGIAGLTVPKAIGDAATTAGNVANTVGKMSYTPTTFSNQYNAPDAYKAANFTNQYKAPQDYKSVGSSFGADQAQQYMNPFLQMSLNPQLEEARRQAQITQMGNNAKMAQAGAFGGSRQAIMDAETQRNLGTNLANITGAGFNTAYTNAQTQFNADQARKIQEAQYAAKQGMDAAQLAAQYGLSADQANELSKQYGYTQGMTSAQLKAQYGLSADQANELSKQYGSKFGLDTQNAALNAANIQGQLGLTQNQANIANLNTQLGAGATERGITSEGIAADLAEFEKQRQFPYQQVQFQRDMISGMPISSLSNTPGSLSGIGSLLSSLGGATSVASMLGYKNVGQLLGKIGLDLGP